VRLLRRTKLMLGVLEMVSTPDVAVVSFGMFCYHSPGINELLTPMSRLWTGLGSEVDVQVARELEL
jgi:hypothetical protein